jgi:ribosomal protein L34
MNIHEPEFKIRSREDSFGLLARKETGDGRKALATRGKHAEPEKQPNEIEAGLRGP